MKPFSFLLTGLLVLLPLLALRAQDKAIKSTPPDKSILEEITTKTDKLSAVLASMRKQDVREPYLAEVEIFYKAATWIVNHDEFFQPQAGQWTLEALDRGLLRAKHLAGGDSPWLNQTGRAVVRAYRSRVDGSVQPYAVTFPADYGKKPLKKWRLDVVLHGRNARLTEVSFLHDHNGDKDAPKDLDYIVLDIYGRGNNAYRWAGETDVIEAVDNFLAVERLMGRERMIDPSRVVLRGFSMGGAGTWHLGLHRPDRWCVLGPGAGFTTTRGYVKDFPEKLPRHQELCLHIYDAVDYAENAFNVPIVAYAGEKDGQLQAARNIEAKLKQLNIPMTLLIAPDLGHEFPAEWRKKAEVEYQKYAGVDKGRKEFAPHIRFVTYTLRYPICDWIEILGLDEHYQRALVEAQATEKGILVKTSNVRALRLGLPETPAGPVPISINGQELTVRAHAGQLGTANIYLEKKEKGWASVLPQKLITDRVRRPQKMAGLQGPIDDAFMDSFLCVRGTGKPWNAAIQGYADGDLKRFEQEWSKYLRGALPIKDDVDVTDEDIATRHLILFGDPGSNALIAQVLDGLPLQWTRKTITVGDKPYAAGEHVPALIYPSPLTTGRYVVLNSGHTFRAADFMATNAMLYPRLGDYAILKLAPTGKDPLAVEPVRAGLFNEFWQLGKE